MQDTSLEFIDNQPLDYNIFSNEQLNKSLTDQIDRLIREETQDIQPEKDIEELRTLSEKPSELITVQWDLSRHENQYVEVNKAQDDDSIQIFNNAPALDQSSIEEDKNHNDSS